MKYYVINPKNANETENFLKLNYENAFGIEVVGKWAEMLKINLDPQHGGMGEKLNIAAARMAVSFNVLPDENTIFIISRVDPDTLAAIVVLEDRASGKLDNTKGFPEDIAIRLDLLSSIDEFNKESWKPQRLPSKDEKWPNGFSKTYSAMAAMSFDFKSPIEDRIKEMRKYLYTGEVAEKYLSKVEEERDDFINKLETGEIKFSNEINPEICLVETNTRYASNVGYSLAPIFIGISDKFNFQGTEIRKVTIAQYCEGYLNIENLQKELNAMEPGWGGPKNLLGSPMGQDCKISKEDLLTLVESNLLQ